MHLDAPTSPMLGGPAGPVLTGIVQGLASVGSRLFYSLRRNGQGAAGYAEANFGEPPGIHDLLDPTTPKRIRSFELTDIQTIIMPVGVCNYAWGIHDLVVVNDWTTLVGVGFECTNNFILKTFLKDAPANVPRVIHQTVLAALANVEHELTIVVDGWNKKIFWYVDRVLVDSYVPLITLDQMGGSAVTTGLKIRSRGLVPIAGDMTIFFNGSDIGTPLLSLMEIAS